MRVHHLGLFPILEQCTDFSIRLSRIWLLEFLSLITDAMATWETVIFFFFFDQVQKVYWPLCWRVRLKINSRLPRRNQKVCIRQKSVRPLEFSGGLSLRATLLSASGGSMRGSPGTVGRRAAALRLSQRLSSQEDTLSWSQQLPWFLESTDFMAV